MNGASALCEHEGDALRRALAVAFADERLAARCTVAAFARAHRRWRAVGTLPDPLVWVEVTAVHRARRALADQERRWPAESARDGLDALRPRPRVAVVLHRLRGRSLDEIADALGTSRSDVAGLLRDAYAHLGVLDADVADDAVPYAG